MITFEMNVFKKALLDKCNKYIGLGYHPLCKSKHSNLYSYVWA